MAWIWEFNPEVPLPPPVRERIETVIQKNWQISPAIWDPFTVSYKGQIYEFEIYDPPRRFVLRCVRGMADVLNRAVAVATWREA